MKKSIKIFLNLFFLFSLIVFSKDIIVSFSFDNGLAAVIIFCLPSGFSVIFETDIDPYVVNSRVLGIGVAVISNTCGGNLLFFEVNKSL